ncbi:catalase [Sclerotinia borealis F-4128]|uniref:Catalase n=1 Tax=Sclerotinia borealis (strain F-4128) TaxID=1432307 RepID=W9CUA4_SCLBF|nr:catalase [Sclerotinia borealis F-4128]
MASTSLGQIAAKVAGVSTGPSSQYQSQQRSPAQIAAETSGVSKPTPAHTNTSTYITDLYGHPWPADGSHALNVGGLPVTSDPFLFEKQQTFVREKIVERRVHPAGSGHFGYFEVTKDVSSLTKARFLGEVGKKTPVFLRFSTVTFGKEFPDLARNPRGFAVKFYTEDGNYDVVGLNWPVFFVRDPMQGPDNIRSQSRNPKTFFIDYDATMDFLANVPESNHAGTMFFSDSATPDGWNFHGYGCHTFSWVNEQGERVFIKYTFLKKGGQKFMSFADAQKNMGMDPDYSKKDMYNQIESGKEPEWTAYVQTMTAIEAEKQSFDPFDVTKVWPRKEFPLQEFGRIVLNKNPDNYHRDVDQAAFSPSSLVPGIEPSPDMLLQWRMFFYRDAQMYRLGGNMHQVPVNCPFMAQNYAPLSHDGAMRIDNNNDDRLNYMPNSYDKPQYSARASETPFRVADSMVSRQSHHKNEGTDIEYVQVRELYNRVMDDEQRDHLHSNTAFCMNTGVSKTTRVKYLGQVYKISPKYVEGIISYLVDKNVTLADAKKASEGAEMNGKSEKYKPKESAHHFLTGREVEGEGLVPPMGGLNVHSA